MKLYVDLRGDRHYLVTDDGEAVYVDDLEEDGRGTELLNQTIESVRARSKLENPTADVQAVPFDGLETEE